MSISFAEPTMVRGVIRDASAIFLRCVREARPCVLGIFLLRFAAAAAIGVRITGRCDLPRACAGALTCEAAVFFTYLYNGVMDVREDRANGSRRPIASGTLSRRAAARVAVGALMTALAGCGVLGLPATVGVLLVLVIGWQYSGPPLYLKRRPFGAAVAGGGLGFLTYCVGFLAPAGGEWTRPEPTMLVFAAAMSVWMGLVGAPAKDLSDVAGDARAGRRTPAVVLGETVVRRLVAIGAVTVAVAFSLVAVTALPLLRWPAAAVACGALGVVFVSLTGISRGDRPRRRMPYRAFMLTQYAANLGLLTAMVA
jgi:4-hydroxybenzoate polyprenyltransferase